jgi:predicted lipid-binding transport protein (Tim44 family)
MAETPAMARVVVKRAGDAYLWTARFEGMGAMMGGSAGFPVDLVLFGMIAAFLVLRLRSILGRRTGFERPPEIRPQPGMELRRGGPADVALDSRVIEGEAEPVAAPAPGRTVPDPASTLGKTLAGMREVDRQFDPQRFLQGSEAAFRIIVGAFAAGNRDALKPLLSKETYAAFDSAISGRETAGETQRSDIQSIEEASIQEAELVGSMATIVVKFVSDQISLTVSHDGKPITGTDAVTELTDLWTFERDLAVSDPAWRLVAARSA